LQTHISSTNLKLIQNHFTPLATKSKVYLQFIMIFNQAVVLAIVALSSFAAAEGTGRPNPYNPEPYPVGVKHPSTHPNQYGDIAHLGNREREQQPSSRRNQYYGGGSGRPAVEPPKPSRRQNPNFDYRSGSGPHKRSASLDNEQTANTPPTDSFPPGLKGPDHPLLDTVLGSGIPSVGEKGVSAKTLAQAAQGSGTLKKATTQKKAPAPHHEIAHPAAAHGGIPHFNGINESVHKTFYQGMKEREAAGPVAFHG
jgi:hypothetical protein